MKALIIRLTPWPTAAQVPVIQTQGPFRASFHRSSRPSHLYVIIAHNIPPDPHFVLLPCATLSGWPAALPTLDFRVRSKYHSFFRENSHSTLSRPIDASYNSCPSPRHPVSGFLPCFLFINRGSRLISIIVTHNIPPHPHFVLPP